MDIDGAAQSKTLKFKELAYSVETGEAEMIGVDFVARGGGNATAVNGAPAVALKAGESKTEDSAKKGKGRLLKDKEKQKEESIDESAVLTADDEESKFGFCTPRILWIILMASSSLHSHRKSKCHPHALAPHSPPPRLPRLPPTLLPLRSLSPVHDPRLRRPSPPAKPLHPA